MIYKYEGYRKIQLRLSGVCRARGIDSIAGRTNRQYMQIQPGIQLGGIQLERYSKIQRIFLYKNTARRFSKKITPCGKI